MLVPVGYKEADMLRNFSQLWQRKCGTKLVGSMKVTPQQSIHHGFELEPKAGRTESAR